MVDDPMFEVPPRYRKPAKPGSENVLSWRKHRGKRETCGLCILDIRDGLLQHPLATATEVATWLGRVWFLCKSHAFEVKRGSRKLPT